MKFLKKANIETPKELKNILIKHLNNTVNKNILNQEYANKIKKDIAQKIEQLVDKTFAANNVLHDSDFAPIVSLLDKKFNPKNDEKLIKIVEQLRKMPKAKLQKLLKNTTLADFGVEFYPVEHYFKSLKAQNSKVLDVLNSRVVLHYQKNILPPYSKANITLGTKFDAPVYPTSDAIENYYRTLLDTFSYKEIKNNIKKQKEEALREYAARAAFPDIDNIDRENLEEVNENNIELVRQYVDLIRDKQNWKTVVVNVKKLYELLNSGRIFKQDYEEKIKPLLFEINALPHYTEQLGDKFYTTINNVLTTEIENYSELDNEFKKLKNHAMMIFPAFKEDFIDESIKTELKKFNSLLDEISSKFVLPKKNQYKLRRLLQDFVQEYIKHPEEGKHYILEKNILNFMQENSVTQKPIELLNEVITLAMEDAENKDNKNQELIMHHKNLLNKIISSANQTELEFKIKNAVQTGKIYDFKNYIKDIEISSENEVVKVGSKRGMQEIFNALCNKANNYNLDTINLLCMHAGLGEDMYLALKDLIPFTRYEKHLVAFENKIVKTYLDVAKIDKIFTNINVAEANEYLDIIEQFNNNLNFAFIQEPNNKTLAVYKENFAQFAQMFANITKQLKENDEISFLQKKNKIFIKMLDANHKKAVNGVVENLNSLGTKFNNTLDTLEQDICILKNLNVNRFSPVYKDKKQMEDRLDKLSLKGERITKLAQNKLDAIYSEDMQGDIRLNLDE